MKLRLSYSNLLKLNFLAFIILLILEYFEQSQSIDPEFVINIEQKKTLFHKNAKDLIPEEKFTLNNVFVC
jgi:hypothetical protein